MLENENTVERRIRVIEGLLEEATDKTVRKMLNKTLSELRDERDDDYER